MTVGDPQARTNEGHRGPGHEAARRVRHVVESVLLSLVDMPPSVDRAGLRDRLLRACEFLYASIDLPDIAVAHLQGLGEAAAVARECRAMISSAREVRPSPPSAADEQGPLGQAAARLAEVEAALGRAYEEVARIQFDRRSELVTGALAPVVVGVRPFRASRGVPQLHAFTRARLMPHVLVGSGEAPALPGPKATVRRPETMEELRAFGEAAASGALQASLLAEPEPEAAEEEPPPPFVFEPAASEVEVLRRIARDCLEDVAIHRTLRTPNAIETWLDQAPFEQRLLDNLDAFAALGGSVLPMVSLFVAESEAPDPERAFAAALTLGSIEGSDSLAAALMMFKQSAPETYEGWREGLRLAPSASIDAAMAELAASPRPAWVAFALDVLLARGVVPDAVVQPLLASTDVAVAERVARALAASLPETEAVIALSNLSASTPSDSVFLAAAESLLRRGHGPFLRELREIAAGRSQGAGRAAQGAVPPSTARVDGALELLGLAGSSADLELLLAGLRAAGEAGRPRARLARAVGRYGHAGAIPALVALLREGDEELALAAAEALDRITGAGLREIVEEPWEVDLPPEAEGHGIPVPMRKVEKMVVDPVAWTRWIAERGDELDPKVKLRAGAPFVPLAIVDELAAKVTPPARRADAARELAIVAGMATTFSTDDWVARQRSDLTELRERVADLSASAGAWSFALDRRARGAPSRGAAGAHAPSQAGAAPAAPRPPQPEAAASRALPSFMRAAPAPAPPQPAAMPAPAPPAADVHRPNPAPPKKDLLSGGTMFGIVLPILPATPFKPGAAAQSAASASSPAAGRSPEGDTLDDAPDSDEPSTHIGPAVTPEDRALPFQSSASARAASPPSPVAPAAPERRAAPEGDSAHSTMEAQPSPIARAALPFRSSGPAAGAAAPAKGSPAESAASEAELTLEQYAAMCAALAVFPERAEAIFARHGLADVHRRAAVDAVWKARLARYPSERAEWERRYWQWEASWRRSGWR